jgi:putative flavoprotein involved in K+ transport
MLDVIVIGAGQAGLAAGYHLLQRGLNFTILEAQSQPCGSWPHYYDSLKLFSPARYSSLPGMPFPGDPKRYPARDEVIDYLIGYAASFDLPVRTNVCVALVESLTEGFRVTTEAGEQFDSRRLISATGSFHRPYQPSIVGEGSFKGQVLHAAQYRSPSLFRGRRVVVVGAGNSAIQIAVELAQSARVTLATRRPVRYVPQRILGKDLHFWLDVTGLDRFPTSSSGKSRSVDVLDTGLYRRAIRAGKPDRRPMFSYFTDSGVVWADGTEEQIDTILFATGYRANLEFLAKLGALDEDGYALQRRGISTSVPGLYYVGLSDQRSLSSATLRGVGPDAAYVIDHLIGALQSNSAPIPTMRLHLEQEPIAHD